MNSYNMNEDSSLIDFINKKILKKDNTEPKKIFFLLTKCLKKSLLETYEQQMEINLTINCSNLVFSIFWLIYNYSLNPKLTMFITERSIILYNEYLNISRTYGTENTNLKDVKHFIINKTIGPIQFSSINSSKISDDIELYYFYKNFLIKMFKKIVTDKTNFDYKYIEEFIEYLCVTLSNIIYKSYHKNFLPIIINECNKILNLDILDIPREINLLVINCELLFKLDIQKFKINDKIFYSVFKFINQNITLIDNSEDINDFIITNIQDLSFFNILFKKLIKNKQFID